VEEKLKNKKSFYKYLSIPNYCRSNNEAILKYEVVDTSTDAPFGKLQQSQDYNKGWNMGRK
jgi:hypothetical protein